MNKNYISKKRKKMVQMQKNPIHCISGVARNRNIKIGKKKDANAPGCRFGCIYCYGILNLMTVGQIADKIKSGGYNILDRKTILIQPACDSDFFLEENWVLLLETLVELGVNISIATKYPLTEKIVQKLSEVHQYMTKSFGTILAVGVTITTTDEKKRRLFEPNASTVEERIKAVTLLSQYNIPSSVIMQPILPGIKLEEYEKIICLSKETNSILNWGLVTLPKDILMNILSKLAHNRFELAHNRFELAHNRFELVQNNIVPAKKAIIAGEPSSITPNYVQDPYRYFDIELIRQIIELIKNIGAIGMKNNSDIVYSHLKQLGLAK